MMKDDSGIRWYTPDWKLILRMYAYLLVAPFVVILEFFKGTRNLVSTINDINYLLCLH